MKPRKHLFRARRPFAASLLLSLPLLLAGCSTATPPADPSPATPATVGHVHGISVDPVSTKILVATHDGLYDATTKTAVKVSETTIDLLGFTATSEPDIFYASGHPGQSDFHTLTVSGHTIVAYDGQLRTSTDGTTWTTTPTTFAPAVLTGSPASTVVLATTQDGLQRSTDSGSTWEAVPESPIIQFAAIATSKEKAPTAAVGVAPDGSVFVSIDTGLTWAATGKITGQVEAVSAVEGLSGKPSIWVATATGVQVSKDGGATFHAADS